MQRVLFFLCLVVLAMAFHQILCYKINKKQLDAFTPGLTIVGDEKPEKITLMYDDTAFHDNIKQLGTIKNIVLHDTKGDIVGTKVNDVTIKLVDSLLLSQPNVKKHYSVISTVGIEKTAFFVRPLEFPNKTIEEDSVVIGYANNAEKYMIDNIFQSFKQTPPKYSLKKVALPSTKTISKKVFSDNAIDNLFIFESLSSLNYVKLLDRTLKMEVADYGDLLDVHKLKLYFPYARKKNIDFSLTFSQLRGKFAPVRSVLVFDVLAVIHNNEVNANVQKELDSIIRFDNKPENINYYGQYFTMHPLSLAFAKERNQFASTRDSLQILEQFASNLDNDFKYEIKQNVHGFFDSTAKTLTINNDRVVDIPLKKGIKLELSGQLREEENGSFSSMIVSRKQSVLVKTQNMEPGNPNKQFEPGYLCYNHPEITSKGLCESRYDEVGNPKREQTLWDKPCQKHADCPFYQFNKNYKNYRGGCIDGRCEMPVGVKAKAYRLYDKATTPLCHNCNNNNTFDCCDEQNDSTKYPHLISPDYAFELDEFERKHNQKT